MLGLSERFDYFFSRLSIAYLPYVRGLVSVTSSQIIFFFGLCLVLETCLFDIDEVLWLDDMSELADNFLTTSALD